MSRIRKQTPFDRFLIFYIGAITLYAVLAYGLTTEVTRACFDVALVAGFLFWLVDLVIRRGLPSIKPVLILLVSLLLIYGWISVWNAQFQHTWKEGFSKASPSGYLEWLPSSVNRDASEAAMWHLSAMALGFLMVIDLCRLRRNRKAILGWIALAGLVVALAGLFQKASGTQTMLFYDEILTERRFFASYRYHGNAATLLNFCWPISFVLFLRAKLRDSSPLVVAVWGVAFVFTLLAVFVNTSKVGQVIALLMMLAMILIYRKSWMQIIRAHPHPAMAGIVLGLVFLLIGGFLVTLSLSSNISRWLDFDTSANARLETYQTCLEMISMGGWLGIGPDTFSTMFPYFRSGEGKELEFFWHTAHQDYLQTILEWGWIGCFFWGGLLVVAFKNGVAKLRNGNFYIGAVSAGCFSVMVQAGVDFPLQIASLQWVTVCLCGWLLSSRKGVRASSVRHEL